MSVKELTAENFDTEVLGAEGTVLVDFYATWCGPCKMMSPIVDEIAEESTEVKVCKIDVDEADDIPARYSIMSIPTLMVFKNGEIAKTFIGVTSKEDILAAL